MESGKSISTYTFWPPDPFPPCSLLFMTLPEREKTGGKKKGNEGKREELCAYHSVGAHTFPHLIYLRSVGSEPGPILDSRDTSVSISVDKRDKNLLWNLHLCWGRGTVKGLHSRGSCREPAGVKCHGRDGAGGGGQVKVIILTLLFELRPRGGRNSWGRAKALGCSARLEGSTASKESSAA